ncbi:MAG: N-6 DNA methylase [Candidatus Thorarchaeota archaeon]|nr:N-6 DNA methylase [Candidatus Thorarchaeota archaeon]
MPDLTHTFVLKRGVALLNTETRLSPAQLALFAIRHTQSAAMIDNLSDVLALRTGMDAARIAALTWLAGQAVGSDPVDLFDKTRPFSHLSYHAERVGVSRDAVLGRARHILELGIPPCVPHSFSGLDFLDSMSQVHSIGSHFFLPLDRKASSRHLLGMYYTPWPVARYIAELTLGPPLDALKRQYAGDTEEFRRLVKSVSVLDPACGPGVFLFASLCAIAHRLEAGLQDSLIPSVAENLYGVDIDTSALEIADFGLSLLAGTVAERPSRSIRRSLKTGDALVSMSGSCRTGDHISISDPEKPRPFDWLAAFPEVLAGSDRGFDFVVMNPPFDRIRPNLLEYMRERLSYGERSIRLDAFEAARQRMRERAAYFRQCTDYEFSATSTIDSHRLFVERALSFLRDGGRLGAVVPSTILGDRSARLLRSHLIESNRLETVDIFPEGARLFPRVTQSVAILTVTKGGSTETASVSPPLMALPAVTDIQRIPVSIAEVRSVLGHDLPICPLSHQDLRVLRVMQSFPALDALPWLTVRRGELDLTLDRTLITTDRTLCPLVRGARIRRFTLDVDYMSEFVSLERLATVRRKSSRTHHVLSTRLACQQVSNRAQRWRLKFAPVPPRHVLANSCNYVYVDAALPGLEYFMLGLLNSTLLNWRFSLTSTNNHVSNHELKTMRVFDAMTAGRDTDGWIRLVIRAAERASSGRFDSLAELDAAVFRLHGLDATDARYILHSVGADEYETEQVIVNTRS